MKMLPLKVAFSVLAAAMIISGCDCGRTVGPKNQPGALEVAYPDPTDATKTLSSGGSEDKAVYTFEPTFQKQTATLNIHVNNTGDGLITLSSMEVTDGTDIVSVGETKAANPVFDVAFTPPSEISKAGSTDIAVTFTPPETLEAVKDYSVKLVLKAENSPDHPQVEITINGRGIAGFCELPKVLDFGAVAKGDVATETLAFDNPTQLEITGFVGDTFGSDSAAFTYPADSARGSVTIKANDSKTVKLNFAPTEVRPYFAFAKMRRAAVCPEQTITLQGTGVDQVLTWYWVKPDGSHDTTKVDFGYATPGTQVDRKVTFENFGKADITLSQLQFTTNEFKVVGEAGAADPTKLVIPGLKNQPAGTTSVTKDLPVMFKPTFLGNRSAILKFNTSLAKTPNGTFQAKGVGGGPSIQVSPLPTLNFGKVPLFNATPAYYTTRRITIANVGSAPQPPDNAGNLHPSFDDTMDIVPLTGATDRDEIHATLTNMNEPTGLVAKVGQNTGFLEVTITPTSIGQKQWEVTIHSNDTAKPSVKVIVAADIQQMQPCTYSVVPANLDFGVVAMPSYKDLTFTIKNQGQDECLVNTVGIEAGSDPAFTLPAGTVDSATIPGGGQLTVTVRGQPTVAATSAITKLTGKAEFFISSPTAPHYELPLSLTLAQACLSVLPSDIDFGTVQRGCASSTRTINIYNSCSASVQITSVGIISNSSANEFGITQPAGPFPITIAPASSTPVSFTAKYQPTDLGADQGTVAINAVQNGQSVPYIVTMIGNGDTVGQNTDVFSQDAKPKADILLVIDDSGSMGSYQAALAQNFQAFIQYAQAAAVDYHIAVTSTDDDHNPGGGPPYAGPCYTGSPCGKFFKSPSGLTVLTPNTPNVETEFAGLVNVGTGGSATETCLAPALEALTAPLINNENAGFLRNDAKLAVVCVTDAPDQSTPAATWYFNQFSTIKGFKANSAFTFNAIAGFNPTPPSSCAGYDTSPDTGKYAYMVTNTNGVKDEICTPNWATTLQALGKTAFGFRTKFFLNAPPDLTGGKTIEVKIDGVVIPPVDSRNAAVWSYDSSDNSVNFEPSYVPEPGQTMSITYYVPCFAQTP